jgi:hypothetical protein
MYLAAYVNSNGVFLIIKSPSNGKYLLRKYTFGKLKYVETRITAKIVEELKCCDNYSESWKLSNKILADNLATKNKKKAIKQGGNL